jgi:hypothetical protein
LSGRVAALACGAAMALAGCGDDELDATEWVATLNDHGAGLELGEPLRSERDGYEIRALAVGDVLGGSITITPDTAAGLEEYERCRGTGLLVCFRADNAVLIFEDELSPRDREQIESALRAVASD